MTLMFRNKRRTIYARLIAIERESMDTVRMSPIQFVCLSVVLGAVATGAAAQQPASAMGTGMVTGHVTCGDTQRPARFASVVLFGVPAQVTATAKPNPDASEEEQLKAMTDALQSIGNTNMVQAKTGTDGAYMATDVPLGDYYVFAAAAGYVSPLNQVQALIAGGSDVNKPLPGVQVVHVTADHTVMADVTMERGAAVSGTISWDDGSPVTGAIMSVVPEKSDTTPPRQFSMLAIASVMSGLSISDDLGHFRISGLAPGNYIVSARIQAGGQTGLGAAMNWSKAMANTPLVVYAPAAFHKADAKPVTLHASEDLRDQLMTLKLGGLHSVSGAVSSAADHHGINSATVRLQDTVDKDFSRSAPVDAAGNFTVTFVPPGTYSMKVSNAEDTEPKPKTDKDKPNLFGPGTKTIRSYVDGKLSVIVTDSDLTGQNVSLAVDNNPKKEPDFGKLLGGIDDDEKPAPKQ